MSKQCKKPVPAISLPEFTLATAEKVLRDIARRDGEAIRKRRSRILKEQFGDGYAVIDPRTNVLLSGGRTQDGCDLGLGELAKWYQGDEKNTLFQNLVIASILAGKVS